MLFFFFFCLKLTLDDYVPYLNFLPHISTGRWLGGLQGVQEEESIQGWE